MSHTIKYEVTCIPPTSLSFYHHWNKNSSYSKWKSAIPQPLRLSEFNVDISSYVKRVKIIQLKTGFKYCHVYHCRFREQNVLEWFIFTVVKIRWRYTGYHPSRCAKEYWSSVKHFDLKSTVIYLARSFVEKFLSLH